MTATSATPDYRIGEGGLLRRIERAARLTQLRGQLIALLALTWLPMVALGLPSGRPDALVYDAAVHVRLLIVAPLLLILDHLFPPLCRYTLGQLASQAFVPRASQPRFERTLQIASRAGDSWIPEAVLALGALGVSLATLSGLFELRGFSRTNLAADQVWYLLTDLPLVQFLLWRSVWRWLIWVGILVGLSRIELDLVPTHPDRCGGIRVLNLPSLTYCALLLFALSSVLCAEWEVRATVGESVATFGPLLLVLASGGLLLALGPLSLFVPQLFRAKKLGLDELGGLASIGGRRLRAALGEPEQAFDWQCIHAIASTEQSYRETVKAMSLLPFNKRDLIAMVVATLLPILPTLLMHVPPEDWWTLASALTGFKP